MPLGDGTFCIGITKAIQAQARVAIGDRVNVVLERDTQERTVDVPPELAAALASHPRAAARFETLAFTHRREYAQWISSAKKPETREHRVGQAIAMIAEGTPLSSAPRRTAGPRGR